ncbi:hypothetical protein CNR22_23395 [Sphingobacteriaceae bacterium]|nr:hypothetical protein CNR22_23395 [Sphingobacteriaceae bacterium]
MTLNTVKSLKFVFYSTLLFTLVECNQQTHESETEVGTGSPKDILEGVIAEPEDIVYDLTYMDTLPCKDCGGIKTTLRLSTSSNKFSLKEEFLKTEIAPNIQLGNFNTERGFEKDENATVYILNDELPDSEHQYFVRESGKETLLKLDNERKRTNPTHFVLTQVSE